QLHGELRDIRPQRRHFAPFVERGAVARSEVVRQAPAVLLPQARRYDQFGYVRAQHVRSVVAEDSFRGRVELHDLPFVVDGDDAVEGRVQDRRFAVLTLLQSELGPPLLGYVPEGEDHAYGLAAGAPDRSGAVVD